MNMTRRRLLLNGSVAGLALLAAGLSGRRGSAALATEALAFEVTRSDEEWQKLLTPNQFAVLRREGTEHAFSSPLNDEHRAGIFACAGCALDVYSSKTKFESGTGWPSFWKPLDKAVAERSDRSFGFPRIEVHCRRCGGHLGHVFDDGPRPTGLRYCMNGVAMTFMPTAT